MNYDLTREGMTMYEMVREFHEATGLDVRDEPIGIKAGPVETWPESTARLWKLRMRLVEEEFDEFEVAMRQGDLVAIADAIMDLHYVLSGTSVSFGIPEDECFAEVHRSNMSKLNEDGTAIKREDGKILKSDRYSPPDLESIIYGRSA